MGLTLSHTVETRIHADHLSGARKLKQQSGCLIAVPGNERCGECPDNVPAEFRGPCDTGDQE